MGLEHERTKDLLAGAPGRRPHGKRNGLPAPDTHLNWGASYIMTDVYRRFIRKNDTERHYMRVTKIVAVLLMLGAAALVPLISSVTAAWEFLALLCAGSGLIIFWRWFWWRINAFTEISALVCSAMLAAVNLILGAAAPDLTLWGIPWVELRFEFKLAMFTAVVIPVSLVVTYLTPPVSLEQLEVFYRKVRPGGFWGVLSPEVRKLPGRALGVRTLADCVGGILLTFGISLGIGYTLLQRFDLALAFFLAAVAGGVWVYFWFQRESAILARHVAEKKSETP